jgi:hypothetical protein
MVRDQGRAEEGGSVMSKDEERIDNFRELLGAFGGNSNLSRRERREQRAGVDRTDGRRKPPEQRREAQIAPRIKRSAHRLMLLLQKHEGWSQADLIENLVAEACKKRGIE